MLYSLAEAARQTGLGEFTILRGIEGGRISATKDLFGEWHVHEQDLLRFALAAKESGASVEDTPRNQLALIAGNTGHNYQRQPVTPCDSATDPDGKQSSEGLVFGLIDASGPSAKSTEYNPTEVSLELRDTQTISIRLAKSAADAHCESGPSWNDEFRANDRDRISEAEPHGFLRSRNIPVKSISLLLLGWVGGLASYYSFDQWMNPHKNLITTPQQRLVSKKQTAAPGDLAQRLTAENSRKLAEETASQRFDRSRRPLRPQMQPQQRSASKLLSEEALATTQSIPKQQDRPPGPPVPFPETRPASVTGWTLRSVVDGTAVLEGPYGTWKAVRGDVVPGLGRVDSIVLWGSRWIVATSRGLVTTP